MTESLEVREAGRELAAGMAYQSDAFAGTAHQRPRPKRYDAAICVAAAVALIPEIEAWSGETFTKAERERVAEILASHCGQDGYEIARELEHEGYAPDANLVEILNDFDTYRIHAEAVRVWLAELGATPRLAIGATVAIPARMAEHKGVVGEVVAINSRSGEYTVYCAALGHVREGPGTHGLIFPWEEIEALDANSPAARPASRS